LLQKVGQPTVAAASDLPDQVGTVADPTSRQLLRPLVAGLQSLAKRELQKPITNPSKNPAEKGAW